MIMTVLIQVLLLAREVSMLLLQLRLAALLLLQSSWSAGQAAAARPEGDEATVARRLFAAGRHPSLSKMTPYQQQYMSKVHAEAKVASDAATPAVLAALDDARLRAGLRACCPSVASLSSESLLQRFRDETAVSEMTHNFDVDLSSGGGGGHMAGAAGGKNGNGLGDPPLAIYMNSSHFYNLWEVAFLNITSYETLHAEAGAEQGLFVSSFLTPDLQSLGSSVRDRRSRLPQLLSR